MKTGAQRVGGRWSGRPFASAAVRGLALLVPVTVGALAGVAAARLFPRPAGPASLLWWAAVLGTSTVALFAAERLARRILPLAALLKLTLVFPDKAPSRFSVALRSRNSRSLAAWATREAAADTNDDPGARATAVLSLAAALNAHDRRTRGHSERVRVLSLILGEEMGLSDEDAAHLGWAALLHDIGKLTVPTEILNKPGKPDAREWHVLQRHPADGARLARPLDGWLGEWLCAIGEHHENWDGGGYPNGIAGEDIGLSARIVSVTDSFETMTALRSYKKPVSAEDARRELERCAGSQFDPAVVRAFFNISLGRLTWTAGVAAWLAQLPFLGVVPRAGAAVGSFGGPAAAYSSALASAGAVTVGMVISVGGPALTEADATPANGSGGDGRPPAEERAESTGSPGEAVVATPSVAGSVPAAPAAAPGEASAGPGETSTGGGSPEDGGDAGGGGGGGGNPPENPGPPDNPGGGNGNGPPAAPGGGNGNGPPADPGNGNGNAGSPPGQENKDWSDHPHGGPPGQQK